MIATAISAFLVWGILAFLERGKDGLIDGWLAFTFVLVPALVIWGLSIAGVFLELPPQLLILAFPLYFLFPALTLKFALDYRWGRAWSYGAVVFVVSLTVQAGFEYGISRLVS